MKESSSLEKNNFFSDLSTKGIFLFIFISNFVLRFFELEERFQFNWDQIQNAWEMKSMLIDGKLPLIGMVAKGNSGFFIGPLYYYLLAPFYWVFHMDPLAAGIFSGVVSILTLAVLFFVVKEMFGKNVGLFTIFLYTVSDRVIRFDRIAWPVNCLPLISIVVFYSLYQVIHGKPKYFFLLATSIGVAFHFHFTAIFFPVIVMFSLSFFQKNKKTFTYALLSIPFFLVWFIPNIIADMTAQSTSGAHLGQYAGTYFHGIHARRIFQLLGESILEIGAVIPFTQLQFIKYLILPLFLLFLYLKKEKKRIFALSYITFLWYAVPLLILSTYKGELTDYYYSISRPVTYIVLGFIVATIWSKNNYLVKSIIIICLLIFSYINIRSFYNSKNTTLPEFRKRAQIEQKLKFAEGDPIPYLNEMYKYQKTGQWPQ